MTSHAVRKTFRILLRIIALTVVATYALALYVGAKGPGGVEAGFGWPPDRTGPATLDRIEFPHCVTPETFEGIPATSVIVNDRGVAREIPWAQAWKRNNNKTTIDNVRVIGSCA